MKTMKKMFVYRSTFICTLLLVSNVVFAKDFSLTKSFKWNYTVSDEATIELDNYDCDLSITSTNGNNVSFEIFIDAESNDQEDLDDLVHYLQNLSFSTSSDNVQLETTFWESRNSKGINSIKLKLKNGNTVNLSDFKIKASLTLPLNARFNLNSKYSNISLEDVQRLFLDSYDDEISGEKVVEDANIKAKYSKMEFTEFGPTDLDIYDSKINAEKTADLIMKSKYSDIIIDYVQFLDIESYDDNMKFEKTGDVRINTKYSDFKSNTSGDLTLIIYDSDFEIGEIGNLTIKESKYSGYTFQKSEIVDISVSYDDIFTIGRLTSIAVGKSKYSDFIFKNLEKSFDIVEGYDDNVKIHNTSSSFSHLDITSKYGKITLKTADGLPLKIDWKTKYGNIDLDESEVRTKIKIKENSEFEYQGHRGAESDGMPYVKIRGYDVKMNLMD